MIQPNRIMVTDTETASLQGDVYDIGYTIANKRGEILHRHHALIREVFTNGRKMKGAFFASKIFNEYADMLHDGKIKIVSWIDALNTMRHDFERFNVNIFAAYNLPFDMRVMQQTHEQFGDGDRLFPPCKKLDLYRFACLVKLNTPTYKRIATEQGWISPAGNYRTTAEHAYRYMTQNFSFKEQHTALHDAEIETEIMRHCFKAKKRIPYNELGSQQWRILL